MNDYCKIFINAKNKVEITRVLDRLIDLKGATEEMSGDVFEIEVSFNKDSVLKDKISEDFLYYPYTIDVYKAESALDNVYIQGLKNLLNEFKRKEIDVVAACDFEDKLI